jgi:hypothetical protein
MDNGVLIGKQKGRGLKFKFKTIIYSSEQKWFLQLQLRLEFIGTMDNNHSKDYQNHNHIT